MITHEKKVDNFYSSGLNTQIDSKYDKSKEYDGKFLSFGWWEKGTTEYLDAAKNLLNFFIENSGIKNPDKILNICCGYGSETFVYYERFKPKIIEGIDATKLQVDYANDKAKALKLNHRIKFVHGDACILDFPENSFSYILGIEGPANFNTREKFFSSAHKVLKNEGELILTDIILGKKFKIKSKIHNFLVGFASKWWVVPRANWINEETYKKQLEDAGFEGVMMKKIGEKVFPGYARYCSKFKTIKKVSGERGIRNAIGFSIISVILGYLSKKGWIEYIYVKAKK